MKTFNSQDWGRKLFAKKTLTGSVTCENSFLQVTSFTANSYDPEVAIY